MEAATTRRREVTDEELREAERGLVRLLHKKRFPKEWIERNVPDLMAQARTDFAARLAAGKEDDTVGLLVVIGYRRAVRFLDRELSRPGTTSMESVFHLADEDTPTPEEEVIERDRQERIVAAMRELPERERKLLAFVYSDGKSIRDAGRRLGWGKSSADRHHKAALEKLHELLDRSLLSPEIPIPAYIAARHWHQSPLRAAERWAAGVGEAAIERLPLGSGRFGQAAEGASVAAGSGVGRTAAGVCGAAVAVCLTGAAAGVVGPGVGGLGLGSGHPVRGSHDRSAPLESPAAEKVETLPLAPLPQITEPSPAPSSGRAKNPTHSAQRTAHSAAEDLPKARSRKSGSASSVPEATPEETVDEFGVEAGEVEGGPEPMTEPAPAPTPAPSTRPSGEGSSPPASPSGSSTKDEFGM